MILHRVRLSGLTAVTFALAGCGAQLPGASQPLPASALAPPHRLSSSSGDLIYAASADPAHKGTIDVFDYPSGTAVTQFTVPDHQQTFALCSDTSGNVYAANDKGKVYVYAHGGTSPTNTLTMDALKPIGCWRGPCGDLEVALTNATGGEIAYFNANASGTPTYQSVGKGLQTITVDSGCSLLYGINGQVFWSNGSQIQFSGTFKPLWIQWVGKYLAAAAYPNPPKHSGYEAQRFKIVGSRAERVSATEFYDTREVQGTASFYIYGNSIMFPIPDHQGGHRFGIFAFPKGGKPITLVPGYAVSEMAVSVAPAR